MIYNQNWILENACPTTSIKGAQPYARGQNFENSWNQVKTVTLLFSQICQRGAIIFFHCAILILIFFNCGPPANM